MKPINEMSLQEACDYAVKKIVEQGEMSICSDNICVYENSNGSRCAVGWLIDDAEVRKFSGSLSSLLSSKHYDKLPKIFKDEHNQYVFGLLQLFHDLKTKLLRADYLEQLSTCIDTSNPVYASWVQMGKVE